MVEFTGESGVEMVPVGWLTDSDKMCRWPNVKSMAKVTLAVKGAVSPNE